jgi:hypothetical protein
VSPSIEAFRGLVSWRFLAPPREVRLIADVSEAVLVRICEGHDKCTRFSFLFLLYASVSLGRHIMITRNMMATAAEYGLYIDNRSPYAVMQRTLDHSLLLPLPQTCPTIYHPQLSMSYPTYDGMASFLKE